MVTIRLLYEKGMGEDVMNKDKKYNKGNYNKGNYNKRKNKRRSNYPSDIARIDPELASEVRLALMLGISEETVIRNYGLTYKQIDYCKKNGKSFQDICKKEENK